MLKFSLLPLLVYNPAIIGLSGSMSGLTYSRNRSGAYIKTKLANPIPASTPLTNSNSSFCTISQLFSTIPDADRSLWNEFASTKIFTNRLGIPYNPSGQQLFISVNRNRAQLGLPPITIPVELPPLTQMFTLNIFVDFFGSEIQLEMINGTLDPSVHHIWSISTPLSLGIHARTNRLYQIGNTLPNQSNLIFPFADYQIRFNQIPAPGWSFQARVLPIHADSGFALQPLFARIAA